MLQWNSLSTMEAFTKEVIGGLMQMIIGVPKEVKNNENRVAMTDRKSVV